MTHLFSADLLVALVALPVFVATGWIWWQTVIADRSLQAFARSGGGLLLKP